MVNEIAVMEVAGMCVCVRACVRACVPACVRVCMCVCVCVHVLLIRSTG